MGGPSPMHRPEGSSEPAGSPRGGGRQQIYSNIARQRWDLDESRSNRYCLFMMREPVLQAPQWSGWPSPGRGRTSKLASPCKTFLASPILVRNRALTVYGRRTFLTTPLQTSQRLWRPLWSSSHGEETESHPRPQKNVLQQRIFCLT